MFLSRKTKAQIVVLASVCLLLLVVVAVVVLTHAAINVAALPNGAFGGH